MPEIGFLLGDTRQARNDNHLRLPGAFRDIGWQVAELPYDCVHVSNAAVRLGPYDPARFDLIWALGFGRQVSFFDRMQLLRQLDQRRLVNSADAMIHLHGKYRWLELMPETHASNDVELLAEVIANGGDWVVKPPAGSYGRDVHLLRAGDDPRPTLNALTGPENARYCIVQRYVPEISRGEKRSLVAAGRIIGSYLRVPQHDLLANLSAEGRAEATELDSAENELVSMVAAELRDLGAGFAAVDTASGYLMEVNIANPGGLATLESLHGTDLAPNVVAAIVAAWDQCTSAESR